MKIMIAGSKGQLGKEMTRQLHAMDKHELVQCDIGELDITDIEMVASFCRRVRPNLIINCAAYTAVDKCEEVIEEAYKANTIGPRNLAIAAESIGAKLVHISTDYVYDGNGLLDKHGKLRPYDEFDHPTPQTVYGKTKTEGENFVRQFCSRHFIIRTAWLYGDGNNFVKTMLSLSQSHDTVRVVNDQTGSPTSTYELAKAIMSLIETENYGTFHGTCEGQCTWYEFTKEIFRLGGIKTEVTPCTTEEFPRPAKRPAYSVLDNHMFRLTNGHEFSDWQSALERYMRENELL